MAMASPYTTITTPAAKKIADAAAAPAAQPASAAPVQTPGAQVQTPGAATVQAPAAPAAPSFGGVQYDTNTDYQAEIDRAAAAKDYASAARYEQQRNAKIQGEGLNYAQTNQYAAYLPGEKKSYGGVDYDTKLDYMEKIQDAVKRGDYAAAGDYERQRNAKILGEGLNYDQTNLYTKYAPAPPASMGVNDPAKLLAQMTELLNQWKESSGKQQETRIDNATQKSVTELERALEDAQTQFQTQRDQIAKDERKGMDNSALYAEARGDRGGIGQEQYNLIQSSAAQSRLAVSQAQTKLSTDTARQIADLRAQGEFEKADALLTLTQTYLSQLMSLQQWQTNYAMDYAQFQEALRQWQVEYEMNMSQLTGKLPNGDKTLAAQQATTEQLATIGKALLSGGVLPNDAQLAAMGMTKAQAQDFITAQSLGSVKKNDKSLTPAPAPNPTPTPSPTPAPSPTPTPGTPSSVNFTGSTYADAQSFLKEHGTVPGAAKDLMTKEQWESAKKSTLMFKPEAISPAIRNYDTYTDYLRGFVRYATGGTPQ